MTTDFFNQIAEYNAAGTGETNNSASATITAASAPYPDLQPTGLVLSPANGFQSGQSVTAQWNDTNTGSGPAAVAWTDTLTVVNTTTGKTLDTINVPYDPTQAGNSPLAGGQSLARQATIQLPRGDPGAGNLQFTVTVNSANTVFEDNPAHNAQANNSATLTAASGLAPYPDLAASNVTAPPLTVGDPASVTIGWTVTNNGSVPTSAGSWVDQVIASPDDIPGNGDDIVLQSFPHTGNLAAGQSYTQTQTFLLPPSFEGQYHLFVHTDSGGAVCENSRLANNYAEAPNLFGVMPRFFTPTWSSPR